MAKKFKSYSELGISKDRYWELIYRVRQYDSLTKEDRQAIDRAMAEAGICAEAMKRHIVSGAPYRALGVPYSEAQFKRIKKRVILALDKGFRESAYTYSELVKMFKASGEPDFSIWLKKSGKRMRRG